MLKFTVASLDEVEEGSQHHYKQQADGTFTVELDANPLEDKVKEFRTENVKLRRSNEELRTAISGYGDVTPESIQEMQALLEKLQGDGSPDEKQQALLEKRLEEMRAGHAKELRAKEEAIKQFQSEAAKSKRDLQAFTIERDVTTTATKHAKPRPGALDDILSRARSTWSFDEDGILRAQDANGDPRFGPKGDPLTMQEWITGLAEDAPHLFDVQGGGGAGGAGAAGGGGGGGRTISRDDPTAFGRNLEDIASGKVQVR